MASSAAIAIRGESQKGSKLSDKRFVLALALSLLAVIVLVSFIVPSAEDDDQSPTTYNSGSAGVKAAYLLLGELGYKAERWEDSVEALRQVDAAETTLVLANPYVAPEMADEVKAGVAAFLERGGRVLVTGIQGAYLIPGAETGPPTQIYKAFCKTVPEGQGTLAQAGSISIADAVRWKNDSTATRVQQRCGSDAVVVSMTVGKGEAVWWSAPMPMTNRGLKEDASLKLMLASVGAPGRRILFDEALHASEPSLWDTAKGLPIRSLVLQVSLVAGLLVFSFGRRSGPVRSLVEVRRSSPLEFAESMGHLYNKAGATRVATDGARRRLLGFLHERCGIPLNVLREGPGDIVEAVQGRLGGDWSFLGEHLEQAGGDGEISAKTALRLVKALDEDVKRLKQRVEFKPG